MKSQKECHEALCEGKTLIYKTGSKIKYNAAGMIICKRIGAKNWKEDAFPFTIPGDWEIYEEPSIILLS